MSTTLYDRGQWNRDHGNEEEGRGHGLLVVTEASNGMGKGMRLELYASTHDDCPVEIRIPREALEVAQVLEDWAYDQLYPRPPAPAAVPVDANYMQCDLVVTLASGEKRRFQGVSVNGATSWHMAATEGRLTVWPELGLPDQVVFEPGEWTEAKRL